MVLNPSTLLLLLLSTLGALASLGTNVKFSVVNKGSVVSGFGGGYWFQETHQSTAMTMTNKDLQDGAENGYNTGVAKSSKVKEEDYKTGVAKPEVVVALFIPGHGAIVTSNIKPGDPIQSTQTCEIVTYQHRNFANCAELNAVSIAKNLNWIASADPSAIPVGSKMAIYGKPGRTKVAGFQNPCAENARGKGCETFLTEHPNIEIVNPPKKRAVEFAV